MEEPKEDGWYWLKVYGRWRMHWKLNKQKLKWNSTMGRFRWDDLDPSDVVPIGPPPGDCRTEHHAGCTCGKRE